MANSNFEKTSCEIVGETKETIQNRWQFDIFGDLRATIRAT